MSGSLSPLEALLPDGWARRAAVVGSACPSSLRPAVVAADGDAPADLAIIAPSPEEAERDGWFPTAVANCAAELDADGVACLLVPHGSRAVAHGALKAAGLELLQVVLALPDLAQSRLLVPLEPRPARLAFGRLAPPAWWKRSVLGVLVMARAWRVIAARWDVVLIARRPEARPLLAWLPLDGVERDARRTAVVSRSPRAVGSRLVLHPFAGRKRAPFVAKLVPPDAANDESERSRLTRIGSGAARAGAVVPKPLESVAVGSFEFMLESRVEGRILAPHIARHPSRLRPELRRVCSWLEEWSRLSATSIGLERSLLECEVLDPARKVAPLLEDGARYLHRLEARCERLIGAEAPLTPSHNDLSMWNVLIDGRSLCIIDWESAEGAGLPLKDFFYAVGDAVWSTGRYASRRDAVQSAFADGGPEASFVAALRARLSAAVGVTEAVLELSEHACWLKHAAYEIRKHPGDATPFRDIVRWLAGELTEGEADT